MEKTPTETSIYGGSLCFHRWRSSRKHLLCTDYNYCRLKFWCQPSVYRQHDSLRNPKHDISKY